MSLFTKHNEYSAPEGASQVLAMIKKRYGFVPNLASFISESPVVLDTVLKLSEAFDKTTLTPQEQQVVLLTVSAMNGCAYCRTVHYALGKMAKMDESLIQDIVALRPLKDKKLNALRVFTQSLLEEKGFVNEDKIRHFLEAGFTKQQVFETVMGVALKTLTNYSNHLAGAEPNPEFVAMAKNETVA